MTSRDTKTSGGVRRTDYPALCEFLDGYLHQDFVHEHGSATGAARAFVADANAEERSALVTELRAFAAATAHLPIERVSDLISHELGGAWLPASRTEIDALLAALTSPA